MRGYLVPESPEETAAGPEADADENLASWEAMVSDSVGTAIEFWGFKRNHGRIWALLYLRNRPLAATEIQEALELSKGAVSMISRELEAWGVIHRVREAGDSVWRFVAETDFLSMLRRVLAERESDLLARVKADLEHAEVVAVGAGAEADEQERIARIRRLLERSEKALDVFLHTGRFDAATLIGVLAKGIRG